MMTPVATTARTVLKDAVLKLRLALDTLLSAVGPQRGSSVARFNVVYGEAVAAWNAAVTRTYADSEVPAPLV